MAFSPAQIEALGAKLDASHVKSRSQAGRTLSYVEGWHAIAEANRIFGFDGWTRETLDLREVHAPYQNEKSNWVVGYASRTRITVGTVVREGCGFGSGIDRDLGRAHESALKESETDSMKRALMTFGNPFGLALYDKTQENVEREPAPSPRRPEPRQELSPAGLIEQVQMATTRAALESTKAHEGFRLAYTRLSAADQSAVVAAINEAERRFPL